MYDDVASSESNPHPGQLFNRPGGEDVYAGLQIVSARRGQEGGGCRCAERLPPRLLPPAVSSAQRSLHPTCPRPSPAPPQDYSHAAVNVDTFLAVLAGNTSGVPPPSRHSSGRVLAAGPQDKVFVYYSDHGAPGILGMPSGPFLYADQLHAVIAARSLRKGFQEMVL